MHLGAILSKLIEAHCQAKKIPWAEEGEPFFLQLQKEAMVFSNELMDQIPQAAQRLWTSAIAVRGVFPRAGCSL